MSHEVINLEISPAIQPADAAAVEAWLTLNAEDKGFPPRNANALPLAVLQRNDRGVLIAGLLGRTSWDWLYIDSMAVHPDLQGRGIGRALVRAAEAEACKRGCVGSHLWTLQDNAPGFYEKLGYKRFAVLPDFPIGHQRIGFMKQLSNMKAAGHGD